MRSSVPSASTSSAGACASPTPDSSARSSEAQEGRRAVVDVEEDEELVVATLQLGERVALVRYVSKGAYVLREQRPNDLVLRLPREALALRATG